MCPVWKGKERKPKICLYDKDLSVNEMAIYNFEKYTEHQLRLLIKSEYKMPNK